MSSLLTKATLAQIEGLDPISLCAQELSKICDVDRVIKEEIQKICDIATLAELTKILFLTMRLKRTSGYKREAARDELKKVAERLVNRVEAESGPLRLPQTCWHLFLEL